MAAVSEAPVPRIDPIQIAAPERYEGAAREFFGYVPRMEEIEKLAALRARGGCWFWCGVEEAAIWMEPGFRAAKKAHRHLQWRFANLSSQP